MDKLQYNFIEYIKGNNLSKNSVDAYNRDIGRFIEFVENRNEHITEIDIVTIMAYVQALQKINKANSSIARNLVCIRSFYKYLMKQGLVKENPAVMYELPKVKRNIPKTLSVEEVNTLLSMPDLSTYKGIRDKAMLEVMYATGTKVTELLNLSTFDVNLKLNYIKCIGAKNKERIIPIGSYAHNCIEQYLLIRDKINKYNYDLLFLNMSGNRMSRQGFWKIIKGYAEDGNISCNMNSFTLRHSFAVHLLQNGADIKSVQELLGHNDISATQVYSYISKKNKIAEVYKNTHPRA